jgi:glycosyltransferase involved in cell wall biosynthesis
MRNDETFLLAENESTTQNEQVCWIVPGRRGSLRSGAKRRFLARRELCALRRADVENILIFQDLDMAAPLVSIVVNNYNYSQFLSRSIGSALAQTYPHVEVVVVDDASTDGSQDIILAFGQRVTPVLKELNAGHGAAFNSGFAASRGEIVFFLDADDYLYPRAVEVAIREFAPGVAKVQYRLDLIDGAGRIMDSFPPPEVKFDDGDVVPLLLSMGRYEGTVTAGNAFSRHALDAILPMPQERFRQGADGYVCTLAPLFGTVRSLEDRLGAYVQHGANHSYFGNELQKRVRWRLAHDAARYEALSAKAAELGLHVNSEPGLCDPFHLENRVASLCLDPANHPMPADSRLTLALRGAWAVLRRSRLPRRRRAVLAAWFLCLGILPRWAAANLAAWRLERASRPPGVGRLVRRIRAATR